MIYLAIFLLIFLLLAVFRVPVFISMLGGALAAILAAGLKVSMIVPAMFNGVNSFSFLAVPAFIFAGDIMARGGISSALLNFFTRVFERVRGSLGAVVVVVSMLFGAITGSSLATISAVGGMVLPDLEKNGYSKEYSCALVAATGFLGILIPPSVPGVIYAVTAGLPVSKVWLSTLVPGILLGLAYILTNYLVFGRKQPKVTEPFDFSRYMKNIGQMTPRFLVALIVPLIIFVGVYGGICTPTEAGAVSVLFGIIIAWGIYPAFFKIKPEDSLKKIIVKSTMGSAGIMMIIAVAHAVSEMIAYAGIASLMTSFLHSVTDNKYVFLLMVNILLIIVGMFLETNTSILLFTPILVPLAQSYGIDMIHFAAVVLLNLEIGMITPPFAVNLFTSCKLTGVPINKVIRPMLPFFVCCFVVLILTTYFPSLALLLQ